MPATAGQAKGRICCVPTAPRAMYCEQAKPHARIVRENSVSYSLILPGGPAK